MIREALGAGPRGAQWDYALMIAPSNFRPRNIGSAVHLWHSEMDANAPIAMGRYMVAVIPNSQAFFRSGEGHLSLMSNYLEEILGVLIG